MEKPKKKEHDIEALQDALEQCKTTADIRIAELEADIQHLHADSEVDELKARISHLEEGLRKIAECSVTIRMTLGKVPAFNELVDIAKEYLGGGE